MQMILCMLYIDKNDPAEGKVSDAEEEDMCCSSVLEQVSGDGCGAQKGS